MRCDPLILVSNTEASLPKQPCKKSDQFGRPQCFMQWQQAGSSDVWREQDAHKKLINANQLQAFQNQPTQITTEQVPNYPRNHVEKNGTTTTLSR